MVRAGDMRHEVTLQLRTTVQDAAGEPHDSWNHFATRRAAMTRSAGAEVWAAAGRNGRVPTQFRLRYLAGVLPEMRLTCRGKLYDIISAVDPDGRGAELVIMAEERVEGVT